MEKHIIGITGGVGSGKSRVLQILKDDFGALVFQADQTARELMEPGQPALQAVTEILGDSILLPDGSLDRPVMARLIFSQENLRQAVNQAVHPLVWERLRNQAGEANGPLCVIECALLEQEFRDICEEIWYVYTSRENRLERLAQSRGYSLERSRSMMDSQATEEEFIRFSDQMIDNNKTPQETARQIRNLLEGLDQRALKGRNLQ